MTAFEKITWLIIKATQAINFSYFPPEVAFIEAIYCSSLKRIYNIPKNVLFWDMTQKSITSDVCLRWGFLTWFLVLIRSEDVSVRYAVVFNGETELSDDPEGLEESTMETDEDVNAPKLKHIIVKALKQEPSLPLDIQTLSFEAGENKTQIQQNKMLRIEAV